MLITLEELKKFALDNPTHKFPLGSCTRCLAAQMTGGEMDGHDGFGGGDLRVDPAFATFTAWLCNVSWLDEHGIMDSDERAALTGAQCAAAIDRLIAGENPAQVAQDAWSNRNVA